MLSQNDRKKKDKKEQKKKKETENYKFVSVFSAGAFLGINLLLGIQKLSGNNKKESEKISRFDKNWNSWKTTLENSGYNEKEKNFHIKQEIVNYKKENKKIESKRLKKKLQEKKNFLLKNSLPSRKEAFKKKLLELDKGNRRAKKYASFA